MLDCSKNIVLENDRVKLEPLTMAHFEPLLKICLAFPDLLKFSPSPFGTKENLQAYFDRHLDNKAQKTQYPFAIFDKKENVYAGTTSFLNISNKDERVEIGFTWLSPKFQRTGLNRNCKFLLLNFAFESLNFARVELKTDARNTQSRNAMKAIGCKEEGTLRSHTLMPDGHRRDTMYYSIVQDEWPSIKNEIFKEFTLA